MRNRKYLLAIILFGCFIKCERFEWLQDPDAKLRFSTDTVFFDTIFTTIGSTTKQLRIYNRYDQPVKISSIALAGGSRSVFRLNIDGVPGNYATDVEIPAEDSLYIFVEVTLNPNNIDSLLAIHDSIIFITNGNLQDVNLVAWGQDVHLINGEIIETETWINDKPYLVINSMLVDTSQVLTIEEGTRIHFHRNSRLYVAGTLIVNGTLDNPVTFQGDRLEYDYRDIPGQWDGLWLLPGSHDNRINYAVIKNGIIGIEADTLASFVIPTLELSNTKILNMSAVGIFGLGTTIKAYNCVIGNCGQFAVALLWGQSYEFYHCTIANYYGGWESTSRSNPAVGLNNYYEDIYGNIQVRPIDKAFFGNCIIYGNRESEFEVDIYPDSELNYELDHCVTKIDPKKFDLSDQSRFREIYNFEDPKFISADGNDYQLDTLSSAKDRGLDDYATFFPLDLNGKSRVDDAGPDIGAYERIEGDTLR
ncbi:MAG: hypothetical protein AMS27_12220 [Bacteroides sp. SM23_62_1]|nr:MAG: hypothetical protein AMS27_12220 [Bacteroides sp. SM23_62_1]